MAKGNLILGTAKNSVGDVVMYRREGAQITRVRVRNVKNPKTNAQSFQRAIMAPIAKFYSPLSVVLERSFEGLSKAKSHNKFNQVNANLARANKWALPKGTGFFPLPYQLSQGTLPKISSLLDGGDYVANIPGMTAEATTIGAVSTAFIANGYKAGDIVTIICITSSGGNYLTANYTPSSVQFAIDTDDNTTLKSYFSGTIKATAAVDVLAFNTGSSVGIVAGAVIVSRFDGNMWRRSTQSLVVDDDTLGEVTADAQVTAAVASYGKTAGDGNPLVYLDGDELDGQ